MITKKIKSQLKKIKSLRTIVLMIRHNYTSLILIFNGPRLLRRIHKVLLENNIIYTPLYGTLLGLIRENALLRHDYDIDLGVLFKNKDDLLQFNNSLYFKFDTRYRLVNTDPLKEGYQALFLNGIRVDFEFYLFNPELNNYICLNNILRYNKIKKYYPPVIKNVILQKFKYGDFTIASNYLEVLVNSYGHEWNSKVIFPFSEMD